MSHAYQVIYTVLTLLILSGGVVLLFVAVEIDFPAPPRPKRKRVSFVGKFRRNTMFKKIAVASVSGVALASQAAVDAGVTTAMSDLKTDVGTIALAAFVVTLVLIAYRKYSRAAH